MKNILITNTGFINKGAELMLRSVVEHFAKFKDVRLVYQGSKKNASLADKVLLNLFSIYKLQRLKIDFSFLFPKNKFYDYGLIQEKEIDILLDAGGFHIGDKWISDTATKKNIDKKNEIYKKYKRNDTKIIFLPQALGGFKKELSNYHFKELYAVSDLFFARDRVSYNACKNILKESNKLFLAPDFTNVYKPEMTKNNRFDNFKNKICIIPNAKMVTHTNKQISESYVFFVKKLVNHLRSKGEELFFLNHEGKGDLDLIHSINDNNLSVINDVNANEVKNVIGNSKMLISSRFHGVVSGLSQAIPTFCTSWSHKYQELMSDYDMLDCVLDVEDVQKSFKVIDLYLDKTKQKFTIEKLQKKGVEELQKTNKMWSKVDTLIFK